MTEMNTRKEKYYVVLIIIVAVCMLGGCRTHRAVAVVTSQIHTEVAGEVATMDSVAHTRSLTDSVHVAQASIVELEDNTTIRLDRDSAGRVVGIVAQRRSTRRGNTVGQYSSQREQHAVEAARHEERAVASSDSTDTQATEEISQEAGAEIGFLKKIITLLLLSSGVVVACLMVRHLRNIAK